MVIYLQNKGARIGRCEDPNCCVYTDKENFQFPDLGKRPCAANKKLIELLLLEAKRAEERHKGGTTMSAATGDVASISMLCEMQEGAAEDYVEFGVGGMGPIVA